MGGNLRDDEDIIPCKSDSNVFFLGVDVLIDPTHQFFDKLREHSMRPRHHCLPQAFVYTIEAGD